MTHDAVTHDAGSHDTRTSGLGFALLSAAAFGLAGPLGRGLMDVGWSSAAAVSARILLAAAVLTPFAVVQLRGRWGVLRRNLPLVTVYGLVSVAGCQLAYFNAVERMPVGVALLIEYTAPVAVVGWLWLRRGQRPGRQTILGALIGIVGLVLVLDLLSGTHVDGIGMLWAFGAMAAVSTYFVLSAREDDGLPPVVLAAAGLVLGGVALLLAGAVGIVGLSATTAPVRFVGATVAWWVPVLGLGVVTAAVAYVAGIAATRRLGSRLASFVALTEVLAALVFAWALLGEAPRVIQLLGGALVVAGVVVVKLGEPRPVAEGGVQRRA
jgi:drug/metabolite transporter (DMT)-like permease